MRAWRNRYPITRPDEANDVATQCHPGLILPGPTYFCDEVICRRLISTIGEPFQVGSLEGPRLPPGGTCGANPLRKRRSLHTNQRRGPIFILLLVASILLPPPPPRPGLRPLLDPTFLSSGPPCWNEPHPGLP